MTTEIPEIQIGLWGPREAGKTTFLAMLCHECFRKKWKVKPEGDASKFIKETHRILFGKGEFPPPTSIDATKVYRLRMVPRSYAMSPNGTGFGV
jgi:GTPase SAR1 family protein